MKYYLFALLSVIAVSAFAQNTMGIDTTVPPMSKNAQPRAAATLPSAMDTLPVNTAPTMITMDTQQGPLSVLIPDAKLKNVQKDWERYAGAGSRGKASSAQGQYTQYGAINQNISPDPFNITARLLATTDGVRVSIWLSDNNNFQNAKASAPDRNLALKKYLRDFAVAEYRQAVTDEKNNAMEKQKGIENELTKLIKEEEKSGKRIERDRASIHHTNDAITTSNLDIQSLTAKIESQKGMVDNNAADPNASKGARKTLKELEDQKKDLQKLNDKRGKEIMNWSDEIRADERAIADLKEREISKKVDIEKQKQVVQEIQTKLDSIK
jgi:hypothetical protein